MSSFFLPSIDRMQLTRNLACRLLGFVFFSAFLSAAYEYKILVLEDGLTPAVLTEQLPNPWLRMLGGLNEFSLDITIYTGLCLSLLLILFATKLYWLCFPVLWLCQLALINTSATWIRSVPSPFFCLSQEFL